MLLHQKQNTVGSETYNVYRYTNCAHALHFHKSYELIYLLHGSATVSASTRTHRMQAGDFALITPYELHSFCVPQDGCMLICVFSGSYVKTFSKMLTDQRGETPLFRCGDGVRAYFEGCVVQPYVHPVVQISSDDRLLLVKSCLYAVLSEYIRCVPLVPKDRNTDLLTHILDHIEQHFREDISVKSLAATLGYHDQYLSKILNSTMHVSFKTLVNQYRYEYAKQLLEETDLPISEVAFESGFQSIRTFNRIYRELSGHPPRQKLPQG